ncbi:hypothetical protein BDF20DRAFT_834710 [Mycotypha africana]|uniref:uncharacterized protein n=1 Tax=Mycotypha africana TaxID=64632 RepID=UPI0022FFD039|nr:uncharacterized protein BDF20DRAFT_834710 [Mycotypha africana]KAI8982056.1 hypothetical protein BDF20DRAFT_834710 [Mycotypha africana]
MVEINPESMEEDKYETKFGCPGCYDLFKDLPSLSSHISIKHGLTPDDESTFDEALINYQSQVEISLPVEAVTAEPTAKIPLENAVNLLYPEDNLSNSQILRNVISALKLSPFDMDVDFKDGFRQKITALTTADVEDIEHREVKKIKLSAPYDKPSSSAICIHVNNPSSTSACNEIIKNSPYRQLLAFDNYTMLDEKHLELLNAHWRKRPWMYMMVGRLLASSILVDGSYALLLTGVESYCRYSSIDAHVEKVPHQSSLPDLMSQYPNKLKITKILFDNSEKLVIGSNTCNILAISSIRIDDAKIAPEVGASTKKFSPSTNTRIFLSTTSIKKAMELFNASSDRLLSLGADPLTHIRQLRSKFNQESTYSLARVFGEFTQNLTVQPFTIYTLNNSVHKAETDVILGSRMLELIAHTIHEDPDAKLAKKDVITVLHKTTSQQKQTKVRKDIQKILDLFEENKEIDIIGNTSLCTFLRSVADITTDGLKKANQEIISNIWNKFRGSI